LALATTALVLNPLVGQQKVPYSIQDYQIYKAAIDEPNLGKREDAIIAFMKAKSSSKLAEYALGNYVKLLQEYETKGNHRKVVSAGEKLLALKPNEPNALRMVTYAAFQSRQLQKAAQYGEALWLLTDVRKQEDITALVAAAQEQFGRIDSMFNNAGGNFQLPALDMSPNGFDAIVRMNLKSMFLGSQAAARAMLAEGHRGSIVSTSSVAGLRSGGNQTAVYAASKAGIMGMTRALAAEWGEHGIRVNSVAPGAVDTAGRTRHMHGDPWERSSGNPMGRIAQPEDIAGAAVFLASDLAGHITGQVLAVDGGASIS